jgi:hypothetical protein
LETNSSDSHFFSLSFQVAKLAIETHKFRKARLLLFSIQGMLDRIASNDVQQEEYDMFIQQTADLDRTLAQCERENEGKKKKRDISDKMANRLYNMRAAPQDAFLSSTRKDVSNKKRNLMFVGDVDVW